MALSISGTRDGFQLWRDHFAVPKDTSVLDFKTKRSLTICNLFLNHKLTLADIVRLLDENRGRVIQSLLDHGIIQERRNKTGDVSDKEERRKFMPSPQN